MIAGSLLGELQSSSNASSSGEELRRVLISWRILENGRISFFRKIEKPKWRRPGWRAVVNAASVVETTVAWFTKAAPKSGSIREFTALELKQASSIRAPGRVEGCVTRKCNYCFCELGTSLYQFLAEADTSSSFLNLYFQYCVFLI